MLVVGPGSLTEPLPASVTVLKAKTVLLPLSNAVRMLRVGEVAMRPGALPALIGATRGSVSLMPLMKSMPPKTVVEVTLWEAITRFVRPLVVGFLEEPPQE